VTFTRVDIAQAVGAGRRSCSKRHSFDREGEAGIGSAVGSETFHKGGKAMRHQARWFLGLGVLTLALAASPAAAQTTANGPYYATPSWDQTLPAATRFIVLTNFNSEAVLDRETGLVWQKSPSATHQTWFAALDACTLLTAGSRQGWRLPTIQELRSLVDMTQSPALPVGHPFTNVQVGFFDQYWSVSTSFFTVVDTAYVVSFLHPNDIISTDKISSSNTSTWCVRGGSGIEPQR